MERIGLRGAPRLSLEALKEALRKARLGDTRVYLLTDWQDHRDRARYALLLHGRKDLLVPDAFGPAFPGGQEALAEAIAFLEALGARRFYEAVIPPGELGALLDGPPEALLARVLAAANPVDPALYRRAA